MAGTFDVPQSADQSWHETRLTGSSAKIRRARSKLHISSQRPGPWSGMEPPFSIPNKEVKRASADDSVGATLRENTSGPGHWFECLLNNYVSQDIISPNLKERWSPSNGVNMLSGFEKIKNFKISL